MHGYLTAYKEVLIRMLYTVHVEHMQLSDWKLILKGINYNSPILHVVQCAIFGVLYLYGNYTMFFFMT